MTFVKCIKYSLFQHIIFHNRHIDFIDVSGLVQASNFSCAEPNVNDVSSLCKLICIGFGT